MCYPSGPVSHSPYGLLQSEKCKILLKSVIFYSSRSALSEREINSEAEQAIIIISQYFQK